MEETENLKNYDLSYEEEPHASRRKQILAKHPEMKSLMRPRGDPAVAVISCVCVLLHYFVGYVFYVKLCRGNALLKALMGLPGSFFASYITLAIHEAAHSTVFGPTRIGANKVFGIVLNALSGIPMYAFFRKHHLRHHKYQGELGVDIEPPSDLEVELFDRNPAGRLLCFHWSPVLLMIRGGLSRDVLSSQKPSLERMNNLSAAVFALICVRVLGPVDGFWFLAYLYWSHFLALGIGIVGIWGFVVHAEFFDGTVLQWATINYNGYLNPYLLNFGYHYEHHDFPSIPARLLPKVREIAPEFYEQIPEVHHLFDSLVLLAQVFGMRRVRRASPKIQKLAQDEDAVAKTKLETI